MNPTIPHRKVLREWMRPYANRQTPYALLLLLLDFGLWLVALAATVRIDAVWGKLAAGLVAGFVIGRLFILGHDACHHSLTPHRRLNHLLGRLAFLPSLTPYSLWEVGHNVIHHGYTNLKGVDFVWAPLSKTEYAALGSLDRLLYRIYRSGWAPGLYYLIEMWWKRMFFPSKAYMPTRRTVFLQDSWLTAFFGAVWIAVMASAAVLTGQSMTLTLMMGVVVPFAAWVTMVGFVVYVHHTHTQVAWHDDKTAWAKAVPFVSTTVHLTFPLQLGGLVHHIMEHTAHHVAMNVPSYRLKPAQAQLEARLPEHIVIQPFSLGWYRKTAQACKLYDFEHQRWETFDIGQSKTT